MKTPPSILAMLAAALLAAPLALAGNTWTGGGSSTNWSDSGNWGGLVPGYGTLTFTTGGTQGTTSVNDSITAQNTLLWTGSSSWTLNNSGGTILSLFDNGGDQAKVENQSTGLVTINAPITFAANNGSPPNPFGEINAVNGGITFGSGTLTVNGSSVNGIKMFSAGQTVTFNNTVSASGKWFGTTATGSTVAIGGAFTSGDLYVMNGGTLNLNAGGSISTSALRLGGDFGNTGNQNQSLGGTFAFNDSAGGQSFGHIVNSVTGNTSGSLLVDSRNTSGTNTLNGGLALDSNLRIQQASGGSLTLSGATQDLKAQTLTLDGAGSINVTGVLSNSSGSGKLTKAGSGTVTLSNANTHSGDTVIENGALQFDQGGSASSSTLRVGHTSGSNAATLNISDADGGTSLGNTIVIRPGSAGTKTVGGLNSSGVNTYSGLVALDDAVTLSAASGGTVDFSGTLSDGAGSGTFGVLVGGTGTVRFSGASANSGIAQYAVTSGAALDLAKTAGVNAIDSNLLINNGGTVRLVNANQMADSVAVTVDGTLNLNGQAETVGSLSGASSGAVQTGGAQLIAGQNNASTTFSGVISGSGSFVKKGTGTLALAGANTYAGDTYAVGGTTQFNVAQGGGFTGTLQLGETSGADAATLAIGTAGVTLANDITVRAGSSGLKAIEANNASGTATFSGNTTLNDSLTLRAIGGGNLAMGAISQGANSLLVQSAVGRTVTLGGNITGTGFLEIVNSFGGTVELTGVKSSSGDLRLNDGTLRIGAGGDVTGGTIFHGSNVHQLSTTLELASAGLDIGQAISVENAGGAETRTISSTATSGTTTLSGALNLRDNLFVNANSGSTLTISGSVNLSSAGDNDLTIVNSSPVNLSGAINASSGAADIHKSGTGTLTLSADNTGSLYKLNLAAGTTHLTHANALGSAYADKVNFLTANSSLRIGASMAPASLGLTINAVTATIDTDAGVTFTVPGVVANAGGSGALTKAGTGTLILSGSSANTHAGTTRVSGGTLELAKTGVNALTAADVIVGDSVGTDTLRISGSGGDQIANAADVYFNTGGVFELNGNNETIGRLSSSSTGAGTILNTHGSLAAVLTANNDGSTSTFSGILQDGGTGTLGLIKAGAGTLTLSGSAANTFTGPLTVQGGTLALGKTTTDGAISSSSITIGDGTGTDVLRLDASNQIVDTSVLTLRNGGVFRLNAFSETVGALASFSAGNGTIENATAGASTLTLAATSGSQTYSGVLQDGAAGTLALSKTGAGTQEFAGGSANTYTGLTAVNQGVLDLNKSTGVNAIAGDGNTGTADVTIGGGTLRWLADEQMPSNASISMTSGALNLNGRTETLYSLSNSGGSFSTGVNGHLIGTGATVTWSGGTNTINDGGLVQDAHIVISGGVNTVDGGATGGTLQLDAAGLGLEMTGGVLGLASDNAVAGRLLLKGDVTTFASATSSEINSTLGFANPGQVDLDGGTRTFTVADGAAASDLSIGALITNGALTKTGAGTLTLSGANTYAGLTTVSDGTLAYGASNVIGTGNVTINGSGAVLALGANQSDSVGTVTLDGGAAITGSGTSSLTSTGSFEMKSGSASAILAGGVALNKTTSGTVTLTGANTYSGATSITAGALNIQHANALGSTAGSTSVTSGAALEIQGGITTAGEALTLNGSGVSSGGALRNVTGNNTYAGLVTLGTSSRINSDSGTLTLSNTGTITGSGNTLTLGGAGNVTVNSALGLGSGGLNKDGSGTATLAGKNQIAGTTAVSAGTLQITGKTAVTGPMTVTGTATVDFNGGTLAVDNLSVDAAATLNWGNGRLTNATTTGTDGTTDVSSSGYQHVLPGKTANITGDLASDAGSILQMHGSPTLYGDIVNGVRFNNIALTGDLDLSLGLHLELDLNPFLLRPISYKGTTASEWGSIPLLTVSGNLTPGSITVSGILANDGHGPFAESSFALANGDDGSDLALNTWYVKLDESDNTLYFHYNIMGYVPEPGSFGLLACGAFALRLARNLARQRRRVSETPVDAAESVPC